VIVLPANYVLLERIELNASAASVTFANIPQSGYTDLKVVASIRGTQSANYIGTDISFNGTSTTTNWSRRQLEGGDGTVSSYSSTASQLGYSPGATMTANTFSNIEMYIPNYTSSNYKSVSIDSVGEGNQANAVYSDLFAELWSNTAAITSITLSVSSNAFAQYSTFSLYGLAALGTTPVIAPKASGGNIIDFDGTYWIHTFTSSGTFTPNQTLSCEYLVIAGGGGGGYGYGAGGGAGGYRTSVVGATTGGGGSAESTLSLANATAYTVTVGAGGPSRVAIGGLSAGYGGSGSNSVFSTITSTGGGGGGFVGNVGLTGGSGGGGGGTGGTPNAAGGARTASPVQGFDGGSANENGGGGGGAGATGVFASQNGGAGLSNSITGVAVNRGGGGGGNISTSQGGIGGGGAVDVSGTLNTGGGGGSQNGNGGSGIVIVRYLAA